jgi:hypothetical protein
VIVTTTNVRAQPTDPGVIVPDQPARRTTELPFFAGLPERRADRTATVDVR